MHFTYKNEPEFDRTSLYQGDIIRRTSAIDAILRDVHPHYLKQDYKYFIVLTQSCDLVVRPEGECSARYISLAAVRPLMLVLERKLFEYLPDPLERQFRFSHEGIKAKMLQFYERLLNNNEPEYFYLRQQLDQGLSEDCCAFLKLSIAAKTEFHYQTILAAKILELADPFKYKLGFLVGNMYSRIDTEDWVPDTKTKDEFELMLRQVIEEGFAVWLKKDTHQKALRRLRAMEPNERTPEKFKDILVELSKIKNQKKDALLASITDELRGLQIPDATVQTFRRRLEGQAAFQNLFQ